LKSLQSTQVTTSNTNKRFTLLKPPQELRDKVYRSVLISEHALVPSKHPLAHVSVDTEILRANHQIYAEARDIFLKENEFQYQEDWVREQHSRYMTYDTPLYRQYRSILCPDTLKKAPKIRAEFGSETISNNRIPRLAEVLIQNPNLTNLHLSFDQMTDSFLIKCEAALPLFENIKVRDQVVIEFRPRRRARAGMSKRAERVSQALKVLEKKMLAK